MPSQLSYTQPTQTDGLTSNVGDLIADFMAADTAPALPQALDVTGELAKLEQDSDNEEENQPAETPQSQGDLKEFRADPGLRRALEALDNVTQNRPSLDKFAPIERYPKPGRKPSATSLGRRASDASPRGRRSIHVDDVPAVAIDCASSARSATPRDTAEAAELYSLVDAACASTDLMMAALLAPKGVQRRSDRQSVAGRRARAASNGLAATGRPIDGSHRQQRDTSHVNEMRGYAAHTPVAPPAPPPGATPRRRPCSYTGLTPRSALDAA